MNARAHLLQVAETLAAQAHVAARPPSVVGAHDPPPGNYQEAAELAHGAKAALEAAALVDHDPAPLVAAIDALTTRLGLADVDAVLNLQGPAEAIQATADLLEHMQREVAVAAAVQHGYLALRELLEGLLRDFGAAPSETAQRTAARIQSGLEHAESAIEQAQRQETTTP